MAWRSCRLHAKVLQAPSSRASISKSRKHETSIQSSPEAGLNLQENLVACSFPQSVSLDDPAITIHSPRSDGFQGKPLLAVDRRLFTESRCPFGVVQEGDDLGRQI